MIRQRLSGLPSDSREIPPDHLDNIKAIDSLHTPWLDPPLLGSLYAKSGSEPLFFQLKNIRVQPIDQREIVRREYDRFTLRDLEQHI